MIDTTPDLCARPGDVGAGIDGTALAGAAVRTRGRARRRRALADALERRAVVGLDRIEGAVIDRDVDLAAFVGICDGQAHEGLGPALAAHREPLCGWCTPERVGEPLHRGAVVG